MEQIIRVRGTKDDVLDLKNEIEISLGDIVAVSEPSPSIPKLNARQGYRQNEIFEILISFVTGIASSVAYDQCKHLIEIFQKKKKIETHFENTPKQLKAKEQKAQQNSDSKPDAL